MTERQKRIVETWNCITDIDPTISTERLFAMVEVETGADAGYISEALRLYRMKDVEEGKSDVSDM